MRAKAVYITLGANNKNSSWWRGSFMFSFFFLSKFAVTFARARPAYLSSQLLLNTSPFSRARDFAQPACRLTLLLELCEFDSLLFYCDLFSVGIWEYWHRLQQNTICVLIKGSTEKQGLLWKVPCCQIKSFFCVEAGVQSRTRLKVVMASIKLHEIK